MTTGGPANVSLNQSGQQQSQTKQADVVTIKSAGDDLVAVTVFERIQPPPIVGTFNVGKELGLTELEPKKGYKLPRRVAEVLVDAKKAAIIE